MLWWTLRAFHLQDPSTRLIVVMHKDFVEYWKDIQGDGCAPHTVVTGGATRTDSVYAGLSLVPDDSSGLVAVHDAARPLASSRLISDGWEQAAAFGAVIPGVAMSDSLREGTREDSHTVDRSRYFTVQTPQVFSIPLLKKAYAKAMAAEGVAFTDDASVVEWSGHPVRIYDGDPTNIKVTYPGDFKIAQLALHDTLH